MRESRTAGGLRRRQVLGGLVLGGLGASGLSVAGCRVKVASDPQGTSGGDGVAIPDAVGELPSGDVSIRWMSGGPGAKSEVFKAVFPAYRKKHANITIKYDELQNSKIKEVLPLQIRNNTAPDVFQVLGVPISELVTGKKLAPLDDVVPDFKAWSEAMPFGVLIPGVNQFEGKTYALPTATDLRCGSMLIYSLELLEQVDQDPGQGPLTLDDFRAVAKSITKQGDGKYFGFLVGGKKGGTLARIVRELTQLNGGTPEFDYATGRYNFGQDTTVEILEWLKAMLSDGSFFPGWASLSEQEARGMMPLGRGGMMLQGAWNFPVWRNAAPDFRYGVALPPCPPDHGFISCEPGGNAYGVFANAPDDHKAVAGDLLHFFGSQAGQQAWARYDGAADPAWSHEAVAQVRKGGALSEHDQAAFAIYDEICRLAPSPMIVNPDNQQVSLALKPVKPGLGDIAQGYLIGQIKNVRKALQQLDASSEKALDEAIATAKKQGAEVSRDDRKFADWKPSQDFTEEMY